MEIRCRDQTSSSTRIVVSHSNATSISGSVRGPFCDFARTLPSTFPIVDGLATVVDPCYWTPKLPFRYEVQLDIEWKDGSRERRAAPWGLRWCIPHRNDLRLDGKRFVFRAVSFAAGQVELSVCRDLNCGLLVDAKEVEVFEAASKVGVPLIVNVASCSEEEQRQLAWYPAVHFVRDPTIAMGDILPVTPNASQGIRWIDETAMSESPPGSCPTFVVRKMPARPLSELRSACDQLQRDLARHGQFAGYLIEVSDTSMA